MENILVLTMIPHPPPTPPIIANALGLACGHRLQRGQNAQPRSLPVANLWQHPPSDHACSSTVSFDTSPLLHATGSHNPGMHNIGDSGVSAFSDANWAGCADSARSTSGVCLMCANGVFEYYSRMQRSVSLSSTESECIALASCTVEVEFFKSMAAELGFTDTTTPWPMHVDNKSSIFAAHNDGVRRTRHINVKFAKVREAVSENIITVKHVPGGNAYAIMGSFWSRCSIMIFLMAYALCYIPHSACMFVLRTVRAFTLYDKATRPSQLR
jgi:hypothetical protein